MCNKRSRSIICTKCDLFDYPTPNKNQEEEIRKTVFAMRREPVYVPAPKQEQVIAPVPEQSNMQPSVQIIRNSVSYKKRKVLIDQGNCDICKYHGNLIVQSYKNVECGHKACNLCDESNNHECVKCGVLNPYK